MSNERSYILDELGDPDAPVGSRLWCLWVSNEIRKAIYDKQQTGDRLRRLVESFKEQHGYQVLGFLSWEDFCEGRLQKAVDEVERVLSAEELVKARAEAPAVLNPNGIHNSPDDTKGIGESAGTSASYLTARIARDRPDILERMKAGEYRSVRAAAIDAGIVQPTTRYCLSDNPIAAGRYLARKVDRDWFDAMMDAYNSSLEER